MRKAIILFLALTAIIPAVARKPQKLGASYAWTILQPLGLHEPATIDTLYTNYSLQSVPSLASQAWACTGNLGAEGLNMIWMERPQTGDFFFRDAISHWLPTLEKQKFYNTRVPMTLLSYNTGGGKETTQDRLKAVFSGNINKRAQVGAMLDYLYSKGSYNYQAVKDMMWGVNGSYIGDRFEFQGFYNHYNNLNKENGGITDPLYITDPAKLQGGVSTIDSKAIPTRLTAAHSRVVGGQLYLNARYNVGYWHEEKVDTNVVRTYIPVSSFIWTFDYSQARHTFVNSAPGEEADFFVNTYYNPQGTYDLTKYHTVTNTVGISLLEGWHRLAPFGLAAYLTHQLRSYTQTVDTVPEGVTLDPQPEFASQIQGKNTSNLLWAGAQLTKQRGSVLTYEATARLGLIGDAAGDVTIDGRIRTRIPLFGDTVSVTTMGRFDNRHAPYLMKYYRSNHFIWANDFGKERTLRVGGRIEIPRTGTMLEAYVDNVQNHIYFGPDFLPVQHGGSVQVISARLRQNLSWRALHWDNTVTWQKTADDNVIPLPQLTVYSNLYVMFRIATLHVQFGVDCDWYTKYYAPNYQPAYMGFANQHEQKFGNYPFMNLYANMRLSKARFYVMMSHINQGMCNHNYFSMANYPLNPRRFQIGVSVDFAN